MNLTLSQISTDICDVIQYRRGGAPWSTWQDLPAVPLGYIARGPWVCLAGETVGGEGESVWLWARPLDIDEAAAHEARRKVKAEADAKRHKTGLAALRDRVVAEGQNPDTRAMSCLDAAAIAGSRRIADNGLSQIRMQTLRAIGRDFGIREATHMRLRERIMDAFLDADVRGEEDAEEQPPQPPTTGPGEGDGR